MRAALPLAAALALVACGPAALPDPKILSVEPAEMVASDGAFVTVTLDAVLPFAVAYGKPECCTLDPALTVTFGGIALGPNQYGAEGKLSVPVPTVYTPGAYDVSVRLADGRVGTLAQGFTVKPGLWPDSYSIDGPIGAKQRNQPFNVTIRAVGANAPAFNGNVSLTVDRGQVDPKTTGAFTAGVRVEQITVSGITGAAQFVTLTVTDQQGHTGSSNPIAVY